MRSNIVLVLELLAFGTVSATIVAQSSQHCDSLGVHVGPLEITSDIAAQLDLRAEGGSSKVLIDFNVTGNGIEKLTNEFKVYTSTDGGATHGALVGVLPTHTNGASGVVELFPNKVCPNQFCCKEMNAACLSCQVGDSIEEFCRTNSEVVGCGDVRENPFCCNELTALCMACKRGLDKLHFCTLEPWFPGCNSKDLPVTCDNGFEYDPVLNTCVAVTCNDWACGENANGSGKLLCQPLAIQCIRSPCPQFVCREECNDGYQFDVNTGRCEAVSCEAIDACGSESECIPLDMICKQEHQFINSNTTFALTSELSVCKQFMCVKRTEVIECEEYYEWNYTLRKCIPTSCGAPDSCPAGTTCVPELDRSCSIGPCQDFKCILGNNAVRRLEENSQPTPETECAQGYAWVPEQQRCKAYTCKAESACASSDEEGKPDECFDVSRTCVDPGIGHNSEVSFCSQFICAPPGSRDSCNDKPGTEFDPIKGECKPTSCDAKEACKEPLQCQPIRNPLTCDQEPCEKFVCVRRCNKGFRYNRSEGRCVPVTCQANPCPEFSQSGQPLTCIPTTFDCPDLRNPCPQFTCSVDSAETCCPLEVADCIACRRGISVDELCASEPSTSGCAVSLSTSFVIKAHILGSCTFVAETKDVTLHCPPGTTGTRTANDAQQNTGIVLISVGGVMLGAGLLSLFGAFKNWQSFSENKVINEHLSVTEASNPKFLL